MQARLPTDRQAAGTSNRNPHEGKADTPLDRLGKERHYQRLNAKPSRLTRENENAHDLFGYKKSTQEKPVCYQYRYVMEANSTTQCERWAQCWEATAAKPKQP